MFSVLQVSRADVNFVIVRFSMIIHFHNFSTLLCGLGSDAEYLPLAIARALQPDTQNGRKIVNIVTQLKEIGAGTNSK